jgi:hypothetical protein
LAVPGDPLEGRGENSETLGKFAESILGHCYVGHHVGRGLVVVARKGAGAKLGIANDLGCLLIGLVAPRFRVASGFRSNQGARPLGLDDDTARCCELRARLA